MTKLLSIAGVLMTVWLLLSTLEVGFTISENPEYSSFNLLVIASEVANNVK